MNNVCELVEQARNGSESAFNELYNNSYKMVYLTCMSHLRNPDDAMDATQDTFMAVYKNLASLKDPNAFYGWVKTIAVNTSLHKVRAIKNDISFDDALESESIEEVDEFTQLPDSYVFDQAKRDILTSILMKSLSEVQFQTVVLFYYDQLQITDIAKLMNCPEGTVKTRLKNSKAKIKEGILAYERETGDKVAVAGAIPAIGMFLNSSINTCPFTIVPFSGFVGAGAKAAIAKGAVKGAKAGASAGAGVTKGIVIKALAGVLAVCALGGVGYFIVNAVKEKNDKSNVNEACVETTQAQEITISLDATIDEDITPETEPVVLTNDDFNDLYGYSYMVLLGVSSDLIYTDGAEISPYTEYSLNIEDTGSGYLIAVGYASYPIAMTWEEYDDFKIRSVDEYSKVNIDDTHFSYSSTSDNKITVAGKEYTLYQYDINDMGRDKMYLRDNEGNEFTTPDRVATPMVNYHGTSEEGVLIEEYQAWYDDDSLKYIFVPYGTEFDSVFRGWVESEVDSSSSNPSGSIILRFNSDGSLNLINVM
ncbi:MAG: sigma-70 family RNA polymerase sigma factor [Saccharofermentans sp.]|nr:sigma-70 family RNA polymerase sigma factor [Saccharofermentans sp.]